MVAFLLIQLNFKPKMRMKKMKFLLATILLASISSTAFAQWSITGNTSTNPPTNYLGTTDAKDLVFKTNATEYMRLLGVATNRGFLGIGTTAPTSMLHVNGGGILSTGATGSTPVSGTGTRMMWVPAKGAFRAGTVTGGGHWDDANIGSSSVAMGVDVQASGNNSYSFGENNYSTGTASFSFGYLCTSSGISSFTLGNIISATDTNSHIIGCGIYPNALTNNIANSLMVGYNSTIPSLFVGPGSGSGTLGKVGVGTTTPANRLDVKGAMAIGSSYAGTNTAPTNGLLVQGNVGVGTTTVVNTIDIEGGAAIGASYSGTSAAPTNGLIIQGKTGIGTTTIPSGGPGGGYKLAVSGNVNIDSTLVIGTTSSITQSPSFPSPYKLFVVGGILTEKLKVAPKTTSDWSDFVFDKNYKLSSLAEVEKYINVNKHLPGVPSAEEVVASGIDVAKMDAKLLEKIEELTLYMIQQQKQIETQQKQIEELRTQMSK
jgi:hypothetical protein